jgi:hypothetical protein
MSESPEQTQDRIAAEILPEQFIEVQPRSFPGVLDTGISPDRSSDNYESQKWFRAHEKRRLKAYLNGHPYFAHGRVSAFPAGFRSVMWPVHPKPTVNDPSPDQQVTEGAQ